MGLSVKEATMPKTTWEAAHLFKYGNVPIPHCQHMVLLLGSTDQQFQSSWSLQLVFCAPLSAAAALQPAGHLTQQEQ